MNECAEIFTGSILQAADKHAPSQRTIRVQRTVHNMFSDELIALMKERDRTRQLDLNPLKRKKTSQCSKSSGIK